MFQSVVERFKLAFGQKSEAKSFTLTDPEGLQLFGIMGTGAGVSIGPRSAMRVPAVRRAVSLIAEAVATLPFKTYAQGKQPVATSKSPSSNTSTASTTRAANTQPSAGNHPWPSNRGPPNMST